MDHFAGLDVSVKETSLAARKAHQPHVGDNLERAMPGCRLRKRPRRSTRNRSASERTVVTRTTPWRPSPAALSVKPSAERSIANAVSSAA